jgi:hypothetical protein
VLIKPIPDVDDVETYDKYLNADPLSNVKKIRVHRVRVQSFRQENVHPVLIQKQNNSSNSDDIFAYVDTSHPFQKIGYG